NRYDDFTSGVSLFEVPDRLRNVTQPITLVDDRCDLSGLHQIAHDGQVLFASFRDKYDQLLAHEPRQHKNCDQTSQSNDHPPAARSSDRDEYPPGVQDRPACGERMVPNTVENQIVKMPALGEI